MNTQGIESLSNLKNLWIKFVNFKFFLKVINVLILCVACILMLFGNLLGYIDATVEIEIVLIALIVIIGIHSLSNHLSTREILEELRRVDFRGQEIKRTGLIPSQVIELLDKVKREIIIVGGSSSFLNPCAEHMRRVVEAKGIKIHILVLDIENNEISTAYNKMTNTFNPEDEGWADNLNHIRKLWNIGEGIKIRTYSTPPTAYFIAADIDASFGIIKVMHILTNIPQIDYPCVEVGRDNKEWYDIYKHLIEELWNKGIPFEKESTSE